MQPHFDGLEEIRVRLLKLERQNRRLKQLGTAAVILTTLLLATGQAPAKRRIEADEFVLRDDGGNVRARLSMEVPKGAAPGYPSSPQLVLFDEGQKRLVMLDGGYFPGLTLYDKQGRQRGFFGEVLGTGLLSLQDEQGNLKTRLKEGEVLADEIDAGHLKTFDADGFEAILGTTDLVTPRTGETHKTSAASLVMFDKNKNVIWRAPQAP